MARAVWIVIAIVVAVYAGWLSTQVDRANERASAALERERTLIAQLQQVAVQSARPAADERTTALAVALLRRPDLIPFEGEVGGTFYFLEDSVRILSDRYAYAACEDGHVTCHVLLRFTPAGDGFEFEVIDAYRN